MTELFFWVFSIAIHLLLLQAKKYQRLYVTLFNCFMAEVSIERFLANFNGRLRLK